MMKAIFYKEWIKTRWYLLLALIVLIGIAGYSMLNINRALTLKGADHIWEVMLSRDAIFIDIQKYVPMIVGLLLSLFQFMPEMHRKCLKLTLHLPCAQLKMVNSMLLYGFITLSVCFSIVFLGMYLYLHLHFAYELYQHILLTAIPWYLAGIAAYFLFSWICLEPTWTRRTFYIFLAILILRIYFLGDAPEAYNAFIPILSIYTILLSMLSWLSIERFKMGKQD